MAEKRIFLVNPPVLSVQEPWYDTPKFVRTALACLAGYFRSQCDWEIRCFDAKFERRNFEQTVAEIIRFDPAVLAITAFTNEIKPAAYLAGLVKKINPGIIIVCGGAHITAIPEETLKEFPGFDIGAIGEGEQTLVELCKALEFKQDLRTVNGIVFRLDESSIVRTTERHRILDLEAMPMPAWDLLPAAEEYYIQTLRGCPFACMFCMNHNGKVARKRSVNKVVEEMEWLINEFGARRISFGDELFSVDMKRTDELLDQMILRKIGDKVAWDIQTHVAYVNDDLLRKMKLANLQKIEMGVESGDEMTLKRMGKGTNEKMIVNSFRLAKKHGLKTGSFFIIGQPNESHKTIWRSIRLAIKINPAEPIFGTMVPYPGTEISRMAANAEGGYKLLNTDWDEYSKQLNNSMEISGLSKNMLKWYQMLGYVIVFAANLRVIDFLRFFWNYKSGAINLLKKTIIGRTDASRVKDYPADYMAVINGSYQLTGEDLIRSRGKWKSIQSDEVKFAKENKPTLFVEQMPL